MTMRSLLLASVLSVAMASMPFTYQCSPNYFTTTTVSFSTPSGNWTAGATATVVTTGVTNKVLIAGTVQYKVYETYQASFVASGNSPYFACTNKGCDPAKPVALALATPSVVPSNYTLTFSFVMPEIKNPGNNDFKIVWWGEDQDHEPYDFSCTVAYNLTTSAVVAAETGKDEPVDITTNKQNGAFVIQSVEMLAEDGKAMKDKKATIVIKGETNKRITAGVTKWQLYESYEQHFIDQGFSDYFQCTIKGCDPAKAISLKLDDPTSKKSKFTLTFVIEKLAGVQPKGANSFELVVFGEDQDHSPYDFSVSIGYNLTMTTSEAPSMMEVSKDEPVDITTNKQNGAFVIQSVEMLAEDGKAMKDKKATIVIKGETNKRITAGVTKWQLYESYEQHFIDQGFSDYFQCTIKGCDPAKAISLKLDDPTSKKSKFTLTFVIEKLAGVQPKGANSFELVVFGEDQDHSPYDFSVSIGYNLTTSEAVGGIAADPISVTYENGVFHLEEMSFGTSTGHWYNGALATVHAYGHTTKVITAGNIGWKLYEGYVAHFIASGNADYFVCTGKGCDTSKPIALALRDPKSPDSFFNMAFQFKIPSSNQGDATYRIVFDGQDQDHSVDFTANIQFNATMPL